MTDPIPYPPHANDPQERLGGPSGAVNAASQVPAIVPAQGGWQPTFWQRAGLVIGSSVLSAVGVALALPVLTPTAIVAAVMVGAAAGLSTLAGTNSAGPRKL